MNFIRNLLYPMSNVEEIAFLICKDLGVKVSLNSLSKHLREHPYFPSLLAVHDEFKAIGIDTLTLKSIEYETVTCVNTNASKRCPKDGVSVQV